MRLGKKIDSLQLWWIYRYGLRENAGCDAESGSDRSMNGYTTHGAIYPVFTVLAAASAHRPIRSFPRLFPLPGRPVSLSTQRLIATIAVSIFKRLQISR